MARRIVASERSVEAPLLEIEDLRTHFRTPRGRVRAVDGVSFTLERGRTLGIVGESGSGKTVLSRSIMGLLPRSNVERSGTIRYEGTDISDYSQAEMRHVWGPEMAMIFQDPMSSLHPFYRVGAQLSEAARIHRKLSKKAAREEAIEMLSRVGIPAPRRRVDDYPHQLSGGMRQRVVIAIALACGPKLLFADEPTTALDVTVQAQILNLLDAQQRERFMAMVLVTHDLGVVAGRAHDIAVMYAGKIVEKASAKTLFSSMRMPYTEALLESIPKLEYASHTRLASIPGRPPDLANPPKGCNFAPRCRYAQERCLEEEPELQSAGEPGHVFACHFPVGTEAGAEALARNQARGFTPAQDETEVSITQPAGSTA